MAAELDDVLALAQERMPGWAVALLKARVRAAATETDPGAESVTEGPPVPAKRGLMIALMLPEPVAQQLAQEGGEAADRMHCTLAYPGKLEDLPADALDRAVAAVEKVCAEFAPFVGMIGGVGRFNASGTSDGKDVLHATLDAPVLPAIQQAIVQALDAAKLPPKREHGFDPHVTLAYRDKGSKDAMPEIPTLPVVFDRVSIVAGDKRHADVPLKGTRVHKEMPGEEWLEKANWTGAYVNDLPDSAFLYIEPGGEKDDQGKTTPRALRHFPVRDDEDKVDLPHLRNALARIPQSKVPAAARAHAQELARAMLEEANVEKDSPGAGDVHVPGPMGSMLDRLKALESAGLSRAAARARVRDELKGTGVTREQASELVAQAERIEKAKLSREYLEEAWAEARKLLSPWAWSLIHEQAMPRSGSRARSERDDTPGAFDRMALSGIKGSRLGKLSDEDLGQVWKKLGNWHAAAKRRRRDSGEIVMAAAHVSDEMARRGLDHSSPLLEDVKQSRSTVAKDAPVEKGLPNEVPEIGIHLHNLERETSRTKIDGLHAHLFVLPDGTEFWTEEDGAHAHALPAQDAALIPAEPLAGGLHVHRVVLPADLAAKLGVPELVTQEDGLHGHQLQVWSSAFDGAHVHELKFPDGTSIRNLTPGQYWERAGKPPMADQPPAPPASELAQLAEPAVPVEESVSKQEPDGPELDVPTCGPDGADVMFVGASPGEAEAARGEAFVGAAGETLNETYLAPLGVKRSAVAMSNAVPLLLRDAVGKAREPSPDEVHGWSGWLAKEIERVKPRTLIALGKMAEAAIDLAIGRKPDLTLPHPTAVRRFGNSGEVDRKLKRAKDLLAERKRTGERVAPARVAKATLDEGSDGGENASAYWEKNWFDVLPKSGKGRFVYQHHWRGLDDEEAAKFSDEQLMRQGTHSVHGDLRLEGEDGKLWGWATLIGGAGDNAELPHKDKFIDAKAGDSIAVVPKLAHPKEWLDAGVGDPLVTEPGGAGATSQKAAKFFALDTGSYELGVSREHAHEIFLDGKALRGRYMITFAPVGGSRRWLIEKPEDQTPAAERRDLADLMGELKRKRQPNLIWAKPGERPQRIDVRTGKVQKSVLVPLLKERALEDKRIVYGVVLDPYVVDAHNDWVPPDVIEETAHGWFKGSRMISLHHRFPADAKAVESSIVEYPSQHDYAAARLNEPHRALRRKFGDDVVHSGAWILGVQLTPELWAAYKRDEIAAFSIEGFGMRTPTTTKAMPPVTFVDVVEAKARR